MNSSVEFPCCVEKSTVKLKKVPDPVTGELVEKSVTEVVLTIGMYEPRVGSFVGRDGVMVTIKG